MKHLENIRNFLAIVGLVAILICLFCVVKGYAGETSSLKVTGHLMTVYDKKCYIEKVNNMNSNMTMDQFHEDIRSSCGVKGIKYLNNNYVYSFKIFIYNPKNIASASLVQAIRDKDDYVMNQIIIKLDYSSKSTLLIILGENFKESKIIKFRILLMDKFRQISEPYDIKIPAFVDDNKS